ncbi:MAG: HAMP domain-containing sensor histidine kinase [Caulobacteraceae bacterium]
MLAGITNRMMDEVERLLWAVKSVGDNVAHDLRTPLTRLRALLYRVQTPFAEGDPQGLMLAQALAETDALLVRFRALQRISEIDRRERRAGFSPVRLDRLVEEIGELYEPLAEEHGLHLTVQTEAGCEIPADRELLFEALSNLLGNAVKFTPNGGEVRLRLSNMASGPRLEITDTGPGVDEGERDAVLERFYRGRSGRRRRARASALSIVAAVTRLHGFALSLGDARPGLKVTMDCWPADAGF